MATEAAPPPLLIPDWPAPRAVRAVVSTRQGGVSAAPYDSLNLAEHVGDDADAVRENRRRLLAAAGLPQPQWLRQVHGVRVVQLPRAEADLQADACFSTQRGVSCAVLVADCLPVLFCDAAGTVVAAAHAGWRGLSAGVLEATVAALPVNPAALMAWLGPAIGGEDFEVGAEVRTAFLQVDAGAATAFRAVRPGHYLADLQQLARRRLARAGVPRVFGGLISSADPARFYSYRRERRSGRFAAMVALVGAAPPP